MDSATKSRVPIKALREKLKAAFQTCPLILDLWLKIPSSTVFRSKEHPHLLKDCALSFAGALPIQFIMIPDE